MIIIIVRVTLRSLLVLVYSLYFVMLCSRISYFCGQCCTVCDMIFNMSFIFQMSGSGTVSVPLKGKGGSCKFVTVAMDMHFH